MEVLLFVFGGFLCGLTAGYAVGRLDLLVRNLSGPQGHNSFVDRVVAEQKAKKKIQIDEAKFVTDVSTDDMKSTSDHELGVVSKVNDDISSAASRLAQLKKSKG